MANEARSSSNVARNIITGNQLNSEERRYRSIFDVPEDFFDSCRLLRSSSVSVAESLGNLSLSEGQTKNLNDVGEEDEEKKERKEETRHETIKIQAFTTWSCNTCKSEFESLEDQRSHFKSDFHRLNIKLSIVGKNTVKEEDLDQLNADSLCQDYDISSISGSEDEEDKDSSRCHNLHNRTGKSDKNKIYVHLQTGERVVVWKSLFLVESQNILLENNNFLGAKFDPYTSDLTEQEAIEKMKCLIRESRDRTYLRIILLARGGHFAACVFDGNSVVAHKTFHRYVVRAKAGKKQSSKDASGKSIHSAGAALRRHNEFALKKDIQELLAAWNSYFEAACCIFIYAPSNNRQLFFNGEKPYFSCLHHAIRNVPMTVRRPTFKEAQRIYYTLTQISYEVDEKSVPYIKVDSHSDVSCLSDTCPGSSEMTLVNNSRHEEAIIASNVKLRDELLKSSEGENELNGKTTPLHEAAKCSNSEKILELLEQGMDPCVKDERGKTPYMLASDKEVRNTFRRFMASNLEKWDWHAANVPSGLTKEMEESQASKQTEKDAKRKARSKELKKLRKAKEKKAQADAEQHQSRPAISGIPIPNSIPAHKVQYQSSRAAKASKEEALKRTQDEEREKRAAAAERRIAAAAAAAAASQTNGSNTIITSSSQSKTAVASDLNCSCCTASLAGIVPFHRYNFKYCSAACMHVHREVLEDG